MAASILVLSAFAASALAAAEPAVTAAAQLYRRQSGVDPALVGYISASSGYDNGRTCDYPQTMSTSGSFAQCCPTTGVCPFFTACSSNTLLAASASPVPCDVNPGLTCNTAVLATTAGADGGASYLACWQSSLGSSPFTFVQDIGSASVAAATTTGSGSAFGSSSSASMTGSGSSSATQTSSESSATGSSSSAASSASAATTSGASAGSAGSSSASASSSSGAGSGASAYGLESVLIGAFGLVARFLM